MTQAYLDPLNLKQLFEPVVVAMGYELVGVECTGLESGGVLRVYIDKGAGINAADCQQVSYQLSGLLDVEDPIKGNYTLEVSSPGLDRPLFSEADFDRYVGEQVRIQLDAPLEGRRKFVGVLHGRRDENVLIEVDGKEFDVPFLRIRKARLVPQY